MATTRNFMDAISCGNLEVVRAVVAVRDERGIPRLDLNVGFGEAGTALLYALSINPANVDVQIVQVLLNVRDHAGNPVVDINHRGPFGLTAPHWALKSEIHPARRRRLLQSILDVRGPLGERIVNLRAYEAVYPLLRAALYIGDIHCLRILLDARLENGEWALNVNQVWRGTTLLDDALATPFGADQIMVITIREAGGLCKRDLPLDQQVELRAPLVPVRRAIPAPVHGAARIIGNVAGSAQQFNQNPQNTHDDSVLQTVKGSLAALDELYGADLDEEKAITEIEALVGNFDYSSLVIDQSLSDAEKKQCAKDFFALMKRHLDFLHVHSDLRFKRIYALMWKAVIDDNLDVYPDDIRRTIDPVLKKAPSRLVQIKKSSLIEKFIEGAREYRAMGVDLNICDGGSINKMLEGLNCAHTSIIICTGQQSIKPAANQVPASTLKKLLKEKPLRLQRKILSSWDVDDEKSEAAEFRRASVSVIDDDLQRQFGTLLTEDDRNVITGQYDYFPLPVMHDGLHQLVEQIQKIPNDDINASRQVFIDRIREQASHVYDESDRSFQDEYQLLSPEMNYFNKINEFVLEISKIKEKKNNVAHQQNVALLRQKAKDIWAVNKENLKENYIDLKGHLRKFRMGELDEAIEKMKDYGALLKKSDAFQKGQVALDLATRLKEKASDFFAKDEEGMKKDYQEFNKDFTKTLNSKNKEMAQYRLAWGAILDNIVIALTGVGILFISVKLIYSKMTEGRALFFSQQKKTEGEAKVENIRHAFANLSSACAA